MEATRGRRVRGGLKTTRERASVSDSVREPLRGRGGAQRWRGGVGVREGLARHTQTRRGSECAAVPLARRDEAIARGLREARRVYRAVKFLGGLEALSADCAMPPMLLQPLAPGSAVRALMNLCTCVRAAWRRTSTQSCASKMPGCT
jgi:hypothetical protein